MRRQPLHGTACCTAAACAERSCFFFSCFCGHTLAALAACLAATRRRLLSSLLAQVCLQHVRPGLAAVITSAGS